MNTGLHSAAATGAETSVISNHRVASPRLDSLDLWRGLIIVFMALDHVRDYFSGAIFPPEFLARTTPLLFFTRWITHFCAPGFFFLAGTGAFLWAARGKSRGELASFLLKRGLWLALLEITIIDFGWSFRFAPMASVIWSLGWSMVLLAAVVRLPPKWVGWLGVAICLLHNLLDRVPSEAFGHFAWLWKLLSEPGAIALSPTRVFLAPYPLIPWFGVMAAGYGFGTLMQKTAAERRRWFLALGIVMTLAFVVLRAAGLYGNTAPGSSLMADTAGTFHRQASFAMSVVAFLDVSKYPPSLQFLLMTLGPSLIALACFDRLNDHPPAPLARAIIVYGRVPLFFYVMHIYVMHVLAIVVAMIVGQPRAWLWHGGILVRPQPGYGHSLAFCYAMWLLVVGLMYFPCRWYGQLKMRRRDWWLSYL